MRARRNRSVRKAAKKRRGPARKYAALLVEVKERIRSAQLAALRKVNRELVALYWDIG